MSENVLPAEIISNVYFQLAIMSAFEIIENPNIYGIVNPRRTIEKMEAINQLELLARKEGFTDVAEAIEHETNLIICEHDVSPTAEFVKHLYLLGTGVNYDKGVDPDTEEAADNYY